MGTQALPLSACFRDLVATVEVLWLLRLFCLSQLFESLDFQWPHLAHSALNYLTNVIFPPILAAELFTLHLSFIRLLIRLCLGSNDRETV